MMMNKRKMKKIDKLCEYRRNDRTMIIKCETCGRKTKSYHHHHCNKCYIKKSKGVSD